MKKYWFAALLLLLLVGGWFIARSNFGATKTEPPVAVPIIEQPVPPSLPEQRPAVQPNPSARQTIPLDKPAAEEHSQIVDPAGISYNAKRPAERQLLPNVTLTQDRALSIKISPERDRSVDIQRGTEGKDYQVQWKQKF